MQLVIKPVIDDGVTELSVLRPSHVTTQPPLSSSFLLGHVMKRNEFTSNQLRNQPFAYVKMIILLETAFYLYFHW